MTVIRKPILALLLSFTLLSPTAHAGEKQDMDDRFEKAQTLIQVTGVAKLYDQIFTSMLGQIGQISNKANPGREADVKKLVDEYYTPELKASVPELLRGLAGIYAANFTSAEMDEVIRFYQSPVGSTFISKQPQVAQQAMAVGQAWGMGVNERALAKFLDAMKQRGLNAPQKM